MIKQKVLLQHRPTLALPQREGTVLSQTPLPSLWGRARVGLLCSLFLLLVTLWVRPVSAHTVLESAEPAAGSQLSTPPTQLVLTFNEVLSSGSTLILYPPNFQAVEGITVTVSAQNPKQLIATLPPLPPESYTVQWRGISQDEHEVTGSYSFQVLGEQRRTNLLLTNPIVWAIGGIGAIAVLLFYRFKKH